MLILKQWRTIGRVSRDVDNPLKIEIGNVCLPFINPYGLSSPGELLRTPLLKDNEKHKKFLSSVAKLSLNI